MRVKVTLQKYIAPTPMGHPGRFVGIHSEELHIPLDMFIVMNKDNPSVPESESVLYLKAWYYKHHLVPYFDMLHMYSHLQVGNADIFDKIYKCRYSRETLIDSNYSSP